MCYLTNPCQHDCVLSKNDGNIVKMTLSGTQIVYILNKLGKSDDHFKYLKESQVYPPKDYTETTQI